MITFGGSATTGAGAASSYGSGGDLGAIGGKKSPKDEFREYAQMTPAEKMRDAALRSLGLTEDDLKAMDPKERLRVEEQIKELIRHKVETSGSDQKGAIVDVTA